MKYAVSFFGKKFIHRNDDFFVIVRDFGRVQSSNCYCGKSERIYSRIYSRIIQSLNKSIPFIHYNPELKFSIGNFEG